LKSKSRKKVAIGRERFAKISAVEGIVLSKEARELFEDFDRRGLTPEQRRKEIIARHKREPAE